ncbi:MAG: hypothetical protein GYA23_08370, partial [Methanomicrobiales archaeon]|nr:hypothetical protein [Methanomicrobiales archaeon]
MAGIPDIPVISHGVPDISCTPLTSPDAEDAARIYTEVFLSDEPTSHRHGLDPGIFYPYALHYVRSLVTKDLSFIARDKAT